MGIKEWVGSGQFSKIVITSWLISVGFILFLLVRIDNIIHDDLYSFGLQYDFTWAGPYWTIFRLVYVCVVIPAILSVIALSSDIWIKQVKVKSVVSKSLAKPVREQANGNVSQIKGGSMFIHCHSCEKTFGKPLIMLDFGSGKGKLVNVCPYCNVKLGNEDNEGQSDQIKTSVQDPTEEKISSSNRASRPRS